jgi:hypothetical protein
MKVYDGGGAEKDSQLLPMENGFGSRWGVNTLA